METVDIDLFAGSTGDAVRVSQLGTSIEANDKKITVDTKDLKPSENLMFFLRVTSYDEDGKTLGTADSQQFTVSTGKNNATTSAGPAMKAGFGLMAAILPALLV